MNIDRQQAAENSESSSALGASRRTSDIRAAILLGQATTIHVTGAVELCRFEHRVQSAIFVVIAEEMKYRRREPGAGGLGIHERDGRFYKVITSYQIPA